MKSLVQNASIYLQLGLIVLPRFVKGLLQVLQRHTRTRLSKVQRGQFEDRDICGVGKPLEAQHSAHNSQPECSSVYFYQIYSFKGEFLSLLPWSFLTLLITGTGTGAGGDLKMDRDMLTMQSLPEESSRKTRKD
ncbi:hypothetical protein XENOCAPTIV_006649 [Xenoophorus captivus]|uniref:Uncharacterized protein n=1 Tax=Xenoophorus captivus TaxID=1517983 RepID=A0ABV0RFX9_9TELE